MKTSNLPHLFRVIIKSSLRNKNEILSTSEHLNKAMKWLCEAHDTSEQHGVSEGFHLYHGWLPPYPETTGYIIETFFDYSLFAGDESYRQRAIQMADWLLSIQNEDGSIPDSYFSKNMIFDTGQVVFGFVRTYLETKSENYLNAAIKAGNWILEQQESDGSWIKHAVDQINHTYYSRVAWSLLEIYKVIQDEKYKQACIKNINWSITNQKENGWFNKASFNERNHHQPFTHTIAYTIRGILETGLMLENDEYINSARKAIDNLIPKIKKNGFVAGVFNENWEGIDNFCCLTGSAQFSIIMLKLYEKTMDKKYLNSGKLINAYLKNNQEIRITNKKIHGAIAGSSPIWGKYIHFTYPNWAAKFFAESLMLESKLINENYEK